MASRVKTGISPIPLRVRIGIIGDHVKLDSPELRAQILSAVRSIRSRAPLAEHTEIEFKLVLFLEEEGGSFVASVVRDAEPKTTVDVVLPLPIDRYINGLKPELSRSMFVDLISHANRVIILPEAPSQIKASSQRDKYIDNHCDFLMVLEGEQSDATRGDALKSPILLEGSDNDTRSHKVVMKSVSPSSISWDSLKLLDQYNSERVDVKLLGGAEYLVEHPTKISEDYFDLHIPEDVSNFQEQVIGHFVYAQALSLMYGRRFRYLSSLIFLLAALAVIIVAAQRLFAPEFYGIAVLELACLLGIGLIFFLGRKWALPKRWLLYQALTERLRSRLYLAFVGPNETESPSIHGTIYNEPMLANPSEDRWLAGIIEEVCRGWRRPDWDGGPMNIEALRSLFYKGWIDSQMHYNRRVGDRYMRRHIRFERLTIPLYIIAVLMALLHTTGIFEGGTLALGGIMSHLEPKELVVFFSLVLPAVFAAMHGIAIQNEYQRGADLARQFSHKLERALSQIATAGTLSELALAAWHVEDIMVDVSREYYSMMHIHTLGLHT